MNFPSCILSVTEKEKLWALEKLSGFLFVALSVAAAFLSVWEPCEMTSNTQSQENTLFKCPKGNNTLYKLLQLPANTA